MLVLVDLLVVVIFADLSDPLLVGGTAAVLYEVDQDDQHAAHVEYDYCCHPDPPCHVEDVHRGLQGRGVVAAHNGEVKALDESGCEEKKESYLESETDKVAAFGHERPGDAEPDDLEGLDCHEDTHLHRGVGVEEGDRKDHQELFVVGQQVVVVRPEEMARRPCLEFLYKTKSTS